VLGAKDGLLSREQIGLERSLGVMPAQHELERKRAQVDALDFSATARRRFVAVGEFGGQTVGLGVTIEQEDFRHARSMDGAIPAAEVEASHMLHAGMHSSSDNTRWDDFRVLLAVLREGSFSGAAAVLRVEQSTVSRRVAALEAALQGSLFDRAASGPRPTELALALRVHAERVEAEVLCLLDQASAQRGAITGRVRLALTESFAVHVIIPHVLKELRALYPELHVDLVVGEQAADLAQREADLALRFFRPREGDLVTKRVASLETAVIGHRDYLTARTLTPDALDWIVLDLPHTTLPDLAHVAAHTNVEPALRTNGYLAQVEAVRAGLGVALLARLVMQIDANLMAIDVGLPPGPPVELWLVAPSSLIRLPRVRAVWDFLDTRLSLLQMSGD
jgi:DNA-binding transcriptional LysR family regulator